ncbi:DctP family TRAP transporter solute-binding subunit [Pseudomonas sp. F1_0610]|uniref:DctP family TRAP transporter solute-binding subunit n=1 Tax=Pseudomonas sp. F1_0610 TaxID=3114284 RepID=UPI0039C0EC1D
MKYLHIALLISSAVFSTTIQAQEPIVIKFSHVVAPDTPKGQGALLFQKLVKERLAGKVVVEVYPNSTLFGDDDEIQALRENKVQMLAPSLSKFDQYTKKLQIFDLPFFFDDLEAVSRFQRRDAGRELLSAMSGYGIYGLGFWNNGMKQLSATKALHSPKDAKGLKFRIQPSAILEDQFKAIEAIPVRIPFSRMYEAARKKEISGAENPWSNLYSSNLYQQQPYIVESNHGLLSYMVIVNRDFWLTLPLATKIELEGIMEEVTTAVNERSNQINERYKQQLKTVNGVHVRSFSPAEHDEWRARMIPLWGKYRADIGEQLMRNARVVNQ